MRIDISGSGYKRALVTGANGGIASALCRRLMEQGIAVRAVCRNPGKAKDIQGAELVRGDVQDAEGIRRLAQGCDLVFHVAATFETSAIVHYRTNVLGILNVAEAARSAGAARLVHVSTVGIYGLLTQGEIRETQPANPSPRDYYQQSKKIGEERLWETVKRSGLPTTVIRPSFVYGPGASFWTRRLYDLCRQLPFVPQFPGEAHPVFIDDVVDMLLLLAAHTDAPGEAFHCAPDPAVPWTDFLNSYARMAHNKRYVDFPTGSIAPLVAPLDLWLRLTGHPQDVSGILRYLSGHVTYKMEKARDRLGWEPQISLTEGMAAAEHWLHADGS